MKEYNFKHNSTIDKYLEVINDIEELDSTRTNIINRHFYELYNYNADKLEDRDGRISRILNKTFEYPDTFLASTLGFNRTTWNKKYEDILKRYNLNKKIKHQTLRNMVAFEKLKYLIIKYYEKEEASE